MENYEIYIHTYILNFWSQFLEWNKISKVANELIKQRIKKYLNCNK